MGTLVIYIAVAIEFIATSNAFPPASKFLNGFMVGTVATVMITYIGEVCETLHMYTEFLVLTA